MVGIICLIIGIIGFVKRRISVTKTKELRGAGMYVVATLFCVPFPLSFLVGLVMGAGSLASGKPVDQSHLMIVAAVCTWLPLLVGIVLAFALAKPKVGVINGPAPAGFAVMPPQASTVVSAPNPPPTSSV